MLKRNKWPKPTFKQPAIKVLLLMAEGESMAIATDGCIVEQDGYCPHGHPSWLLRLGLI